MVIIKTSRELALMREAGRVVAEALQKAAEAVRPGVTTAELDALIRGVILKRGAEPSFYGYQGFPGNACISVNEQVIHGIPGSRRLIEGDIVSIDVGAKLNGYQGDAARTIPVGRVDEKALRLISVTEDSFHMACQAARAGGRIGDIGAAVQTRCEAEGYSVVRKYVGHGIGKDMHEDPAVPNYGPPGKGIRLAAGMTLAIEPMVNAGGGDIRVLEDGWTVVTADSSLSAHYENTVAITDGEPEILTAL